MFKQLRKIRRLIDFDLTSTRLITALRALRSMIHLTSSCLVFHTRRLITGRLGKCQTFAEMDRCMKACIFTKHPLLQSAMHPSVSANAWRLLRRSSNTSSEIGTLWSPITLLIDRHLKKLLQHTKGPGFYETRCMCSYLRSIFNGLRNFANFLV